MSATQFTPIQTAKGILKTFNKGNYSIAAARIRDLEPKKREEVLTLVRARMTSEEWGVMKRYIRDLV